jgi:hypothetical protein
MNSKDSVPPPNNSDEYEYSFANQIKRGRKSLQHLRVGYLQILRPSEDKPDHWLCECQYCLAKTKIEFSTDDLLSTKVSTCGCKRPTNKDFPEYSIWKQSRNRCRNANHKDFWKYGQRGIVFDPRWDDFAQLYRDLGPKFGPIATLERRNNDGPYKVENCYWASPVEQAASRSKRGTRKQEQQEREALERAAAAQSGPRTLAQFTQQELLDHAIVCENSAEDLNSWREAMEERLKCSGDETLRQKYNSEVLPKLCREQERYRNSAYWASTYMDNHHKIQYWNAKGDLAAKAKEKKAAEEAERQKQLAAQERADKLAAMTPEEREAFLANEAADQRQREEKARIDAMWWPEYAEAEGLVDLFHLTPA